MVKELRRDQHHRQRLAHGGLHGFQLGLYQFINLRESIHLRFGSRPAKGPRSKAADDLPHVGLGILLAQRRVKQDARVVRRRPDIGDGRLELHPVDHDARHGEVAFAVVQRAVVVQHLRRNDATVRLLPIANNPTALQRKVFDTPAKLIDLRLVNAVHQVRIAHRLHALGGAVEVDRLPHDQPQWRTFHSRRQDRRGLHADDELARIRKTLQPHAGRR